jgi:hypothetical protein
MVSNKAHPATVMKSLTSACKFAAF